jgi:hypothetical protein
VFSGNKIGLLVRFFLRSPLCTFLFCRCNYNAKVQGVFICAVALFAAKWLFFCLRIAYLVMEEEEEEEEE